MPFKRRDSRQENLLCDQPCRCPIEKNPGAIRSCPAQHKKPSVHAKLHDGIRELPKATVVPNLRRVVPTGLAVSVVKETSQLLNAKLTGQVANHYRRDVGQVLQEPAEKSRRAELRGKA
jgi:hypothetical protein